jgi:hypothetical protein
MPTAEQIQRAIQQVKDQRTLIQVLLQGTLGWKIPQDVGEVEEIAYAWSADDLHAEGLDKKIVDGQVWQIQPLDPDVVQPWGIFVLEFKHEDAFVAGRGLTGPLRKVLRGLVPKRRRHSNLPAWNRENLLFICTHRYQHFRFAYFKNPEGTKTAPLVTFGWGPGTPARTACEFNLPSLVWPEDSTNTDAWLDQWRAAFDKERLTKDFFTTFASLYYKVVEDIQGTPELSDEAGRLAQLLLDRLLFLYFIQRKGWLNQERDYLYSRFLRCDAEDPNGHSYYSTVLYPLFLKLSDSESTDEDVGDVPFLNGGLFEERRKQTQRQEIAHARLRIRNSTFGLLFSELLERFNFTVTEDTPLDVEVAIDPEMLGRIFETLILRLEQDPDTDLRRLTGSYYTPRSIVHFMCQEALREYLAGQMAGDDQTSIDLWREKFGQLLDLDQAEQMSQEQLAVLEQLVSPVEAKVLSQAVVSCRVCDPAVGSGAFLVGMLHEMVAAKGRFDLRAHGRKVFGRQNYYYDIKKQVIESCLYGVDIQEQAVRLCELRLWLSLVVDYEIDQAKPFAIAIREIPSLPNLSYRIVRGDSLLERLFGHVVQLDIMAKDHSTRDFIGSILADKRAYFRESNNEKKRSFELNILAKQADLAERLIEAKRGGAGVQGDLWGREGITGRAQKEKVKEENRRKEWVELRQKVARAKAEIGRLAGHKGHVDRGDIETLRRQYFHTGDHPTFLWRMDFAEVFTDKGGFDVVIGNPPYGLEFSDAEKDILKTRYDHIVERIRNSFLYFTGLSYDLLVPGGFLSFILPNEFIFQIYMTKARTFFVENAAVPFVVNLGDSIFDAVVPSCVVGMRKVRQASACSLSYAIRVADLRECPRTSLSDRLDIDTFAESSRDVVRTTPNYGFSFDVTRSALVSYLASKFTPFEHYCKDVANGVCTSCDEVYILPVGELRKSGIEARYLKPCVRGTHINRFYSPKKAEEMLLYVTAESDIEDAKGLREYLSGYKSLLIQKCVEKRDGHRPWPVLFRARYPELFDCPKIMIRQTADRIIAAPDMASGFYCINSVNVVQITELHREDILFFVGLLNSSLVNFFYTEISQEMGRVMAEVKPARIRALPICEGDTASRKAIREVVTNIVSRKADDASADVSKLEEKLNRLVYKLYDLTGQQIDVIEGFCHTQ